MNSLYHMRRGCVGVGFAIAAMLCLPASPAQAGAPGSEDSVLFEQRYNLLIQDQDVASVLRQFGAMAGVPVIVSDGVTGRASVRIESATGQEILDGFASQYGLDWRYDGHRIEISNQSEQVSRVLSLSGVSLGQLQDALSQLRAYDSDYPISAIDGELALVAGPPRYVALVEIVLSRLVQSRKAEEERARQIAEERALQERERASREQQALQDIQGRSAPSVRVIRGGNWGG